MKVDSVYKKKGIYGIRNKVNEKIYIGKTQVNFGDRWDSHKSKLRGNKHDNPHLQHAWNKYGENNFKFIILEECVEDVSLEEINDLEIQYIKEYKNKKQSYNISDGGDGAHGCHLSEEAKRKIGIKNHYNGLGRKASEATRKKMSIAQSNRKHTPESIAKMKEIHKGKVFSKETREKISKTLQEHPTNQKHSKETIINLRRDREQCGLSVKELGEKYNIGERYVRMLINYKRWKNLRP